MILHLSRHSAELRVWSPLFLFPGQFLYVIQWLFYLKHKTKAGRRGWNPYILCCAFNDKPKSNSFVCIMCLVSSPAISVITPSSPFTAKWRKGRWWPSWTNSNNLWKKPWINLIASQLGLGSWERVEHVLPPNPHTHLIGQKSSSLNHKQRVEKTREGVGLEKWLRLTCLDKHRKMKWERQPVLMERL